MIVPEATTARRTVKFWTDFAETWLVHAQDVEIIVKPIPRVVSNWLIGIGKILATLIKLKVTAASSIGSPC